MSGFNVNNPVSRRTSIVNEGQQSLLNAISKFVNAVDTMDDTVMIPCRLRDMPVESLSIPDIAEENNNKAVVPAMHVSGDLYHFYSMLHVIRNEITAGPNMNEEDLTNENEENTSEHGSSSDNAKKSAANFRFHLRGLFSLLHQMTETAKFLSSRYEKEVNSTQNGVSSVSSFNM